ncbi:MAG TPA: hypothetical protein VJW75_07560 [Candidatus Eisenbacteria bacterium]|nr:hypothetical protein [Candidatus Eisenbacteria bacterium]
MTTTRPKSARKPERRKRRAGWVRPFFRASHALDASMRLIGATLHTVAVSRRCAHRRPIQTSKQLQSALDLLVIASARLMKAARELAELTECVAREPGTPRVVPDIAVAATERWVEMARWLAEATNEVFHLHRSVLDGLKSGTLVPEQPADRRPRIVLAPRPVPVRAFLARRRPRAADRIAPILLRRRRTPRPAALRVPRRGIRGRAPPLSPVCAL